MIESGAGSVRARGVVAAAGIALAAAFGGGVAGAAPAAEAPRAPAATTIGVLYFDYGGKNAELEPLSKGLAQMLISDLAAVDTIRVVERERLQAVLDEQKLGHGGKIDGRTAARIGKLLGARYLVLGTYFDAMGAFRADARLVNVETGQIVKSIGANGKAEDFMSLEQTLAEGLRKATAELPPPPAGTDRKPAERGGGHSAGEHGVAKPPAPPASKPPKPPHGLKASTAVTYGKALAAADVGDRKQATTLFKSVLADQPDFELAQRDLDRLIQ